MARSRQYPKEAMTDAEYEYDPQLLANIALAESLPYYLEQEVRGIGLNLNANQFMCCKQEGSIFSGKSFRFIEKFAYLSSNITSTESNVNTQLVKAWTANDRLSIIWKSDLSDKIKRDFFQAATVLILLYRCTIWMLKKRIEKKLDENYTRMPFTVFNKSWEQHPRK